MTNMNNKINISPIEEIIDEARNGRMYILVDDPNRENGIMALKVGLFMIILALSFCIVFLIQTSAIQVMPI